VVCSGQWQLKVGAWGMGAQQEEGCGHVGSCSCGRLHMKLGALSRGAKVVQGRRRGVVTRCVARPLWLLQRSAVSCCCVLL
jgi:hypothetical protein